MKHESIATYLIIILVIIINIILIVIAESISFKLIAGYLLFAIIITLIVHYLYHKLSNYYEIDDADRVYENDLFILNHIVVSFLVLKMLWNLPKMREYKRLKRKRSLPDDWGFNPDDFNIK